MYTVKTGKSDISFMAVMAIWAISLTVNLPGLAVTPMLARLQSIFPDATELKVQLLTSLPNVLIIPFVLLSGKLSMSRSKIAIVVWALVIYLACGISYMFAHSMIALIVISSLLGCGCGLLIPLAAGLIADTFAGKYRVRQMGIKSGISNLALVVATVMVGWLAKDNDWHLPFLVYLIPAIPLALSPFLKQIPANELYYSANTSETAETSKVSVQQKCVRDGFFITRILGLIGVYVVVCIAILAISYYLPFIGEKHHVGSGAVGVATSLLYLAIFIPGFILLPITRRLRGATLAICSVSMAVGLILIAIFPAEWTFCVGALLTGAGYGVFQPIIYDKATLTVTDPSKSTLALSFVLAANYLSVAVAPFLIKGVAEIFHQQLNERFSFFFTFVMMVIFIVIVIAMRNSFVFKVHDPDDLGDGNS